MLTNHLRNLSLHRLVPQEDTTEYQAYPVSLLCLPEIILEYLKMVYYFTSNAVQPSAFIYVGKDKFESMGSFFSFEHAAEI